MLALSCQACGADVSGAEQSPCETYDRVEIPTTEPDVTRVSLHGGTCPCCARRFKAEAPAGLEPGSPFGPNIRAFVIYLRAVQGIPLARLRDAHRRKRPRRPLPGMMLHQDGSRHVWLGGQPAMDLIVTLDDATSTIYSAFLVEEEGTGSTFRALNDVFGRHGLPLSLYTDRGSHYSHTPEAGGKVDRTCLTQVGRALDHLGVEHIAAYSPQARGRSERVFRTLQDRLPKELALAGITTPEAADTFLRDVYIPAHNARFAIKPEQEGSAFVAVPGVDLAEILCTQDERQVGNDNCVSFNRLKLQIPESPLRAHFVKATVKVRHYPDGSHAIFHGQRCIGRYDQSGTALDPSKAA